MTDTRIALLDWRGVTKNTLRGFANIRLPNHLVIHDVAIHVKNGRWWCAMPSVPQMENGQHRVKDGKTQWKRILEWDDRDISDRFSDAVVGLVRAQHSLSE